MLLLKLDHKKGRFVLLALIVVVYLTLAVASVLTKNPLSDEGWFASPAVNLITNGSMGTLIIEPTGSCQVVNKPGAVLRGLDQHTYWIMPLHILAQAAWYKVAGFSLASMRILSVAWGLVALLAWFSIANTLAGNHKTALLVMLMIAVDFTFISVADIGRMDMMSAALGFAALAAYLSLRERNLKLAVLVSQGLVVASGLTHPNGLMAFAGVLFVAVYFDRRSIRARHLLIAAIPYALGAAAWAAYIIQSPGDFLDQVDANTSGRIPGLTSPLTSIATEVKLRYLGAYGFAPHSSGLAHLAILVLGVYAAAVVAAVSIRGIRQHKGYRALLMLTAIYVVIQTSFNQKLVYYLIHTVPMFAAILAILFQWCWTNRYVPRWMVAATACGLLLIQIGGSLHPVLRNPYHKNYLTAVDYLKRNSNAKTEVMGSAALGFGLGFTSGLVDDVLLGYHSGKRPDYIVVEDFYYRQAFENLRTAQPDAYRHITELLGQYRKVYDNSYYKIYARL